jgi:hypothetical protein
MFLCINVTCETIAFTFLLVPSIVYKNLINVQAECYVYFMFLCINVTCESFVFTYSVAPSIVYENLVKKLFHTIPKVYLRYVLNLTVTCQTFCVYIFRGARYNLYKCENPAAVRLF